MIEFLSLGALLGLSAGFSPGPLLTLVISETLRYDIKAGVKVALAPIITDLPIILITYLILAKLSHFQGVLGIISLVGGVLVFYLGVTSLRTRGVEIAIQEEESRSLTKAILTNLLSPHPYLFWFSVGAPTLTKALNQHAIAPLAFLGGFYGLLVGSKILIALFVARSKSFLTGRWYRYVMRILGLILCILAVALFREGFHLLGIV